MKGAGHSGLQEAGAHRLDAGWTSAGKGAVLLSSQASEHDSGGYGRSDPGLLFAAAWLSYGVTKPLTRLVLAMRQVRRGAFDQAESVLLPTKT